VASDRSTHYAVSALRYQSDGSRVYKVRVHRVRAGSVDPPMEVLRSQIINALECGTRFIAISLSEGGRYTAHAPLQLVDVGGERYLRCDMQPLAADDLPGVLEF
jgi:hypothetical protein